MRARWISRAPLARKLGVVGLATACVAVAPVIVSTTTARAQIAAPTVAPTIARASSEFVVADTTREAQIGHRLIITGRLRPAKAGDAVYLMLHERRHWVTVGHAFTRRSGRFAVSDQVSGLGMHMARVAFAGTSTVQPASTKVGLTVGLVPEVASWYYDQGDTACGFHATYGVANKTLPCGAQVHLVYDGHAVTATVDDRGPYVSGRTFDLSQTTAGALGMDGVATVLAS